MHTISQSLLDGLSLAGGGVPIYVQLRDQILGALGEGRLKPGDQMPTLRQVAVTLKIDLNTVRHAYDELEAMGAIRLERGRGSFVNAPPAPPDAAQHDRDLDDVARQAIGLARARGLNPNDLAERISALTKETSDGEH
jgi:GntR family transcriptional regulator